MAIKAREYVDYSIENSVHAAEQFGTPGASQDVDVLRPPIDRRRKGAGHLRTG